MDGAKAFALPTKYGQCLFVEELSNLDNIINWKAFNFDDSLWFETMFSLSNLDIISTSNKKLSASLQQVLLQVKTLNPDFFLTNKGYNVKTKLDYPQQWGLGSSSTLIDLLSQWIDVDPYKLNALTFKTSGYDIACAHHQGPILFTNQPSIEVKELQLDWDFKNQLFFVYLNQKQDTQAVVGNHYKNKPKDFKLINDLSEMVLEATKVKNITDLELILDVYQQRLSDFMQIPQAKDLYFPDYKGTVKSLGAWGGDFVLVTYKKGMEEYFKSKGFETIIPFTDMVL